MAIDDCKCEECGLIAHLDNFRDFVKLPNGDSDYIFICPNCGTNNRPVYLGFDKLFAFSEGLELAED